MRKNTKNFIVMLAVIPFLFSLSNLPAWGSDCPCDPDGRADAVNGGRLINPKRMLPKRAPEPWQDIVSKRQAQFAANPNDKRFARPLAMPSAVTEPRFMSANEADPVDGVLTEWWCSSNGVPDEFDKMWMAIIGATVRAGAKAYVYLFSYLGHDDETTLNTCSAMLEEQEAVSLDEVEWIQDFSTDSFWIRDFGPLFVRDTDTRELSIEDPLYYPFRLLDDDQPADFASRIGVLHSDFNLYFEGGNFLPNGGGLCIVSSVVLDANPHFSEDEIRNMFCQELGCTELVIVQALDDSATGHVDMWLAWADHTTLLVGEYTNLQDRVNRAIIEDNVTKNLEGLIDPASEEPIEIVRVPMPSNCPPSLEHTWPHEPPAAPRCPGLPSKFRSWRTYLNVLFINNSVLMPVYAQDRTYEEEAKRIWTDLGFDVVPVKADAITPLAGQIHCITKTLDEGGY